MALGGHMEKKIFDENLKIFLKVPFDPPLIFSTNPLVPGKFVFDFFAQIHSTGVFYD
jgi:hypothetical protein